MIIRTILIAGALLLHHDGGVIRSAPPPQEIAPKASAPESIFQDPELDGPVTCSAPNWIDGQPVEACHPTTPADEEGK